MVDLCGSFPVLISAQLRLKVLDGLYKVVRHESHWSPLQGLKWTAIFLLPKCILGFELCLMRNNDRYARRQRVLLNVDTTTVSMYVVFSPITQCGAKTGSDFLFDGVIVQFDNCFLTKAVAFH